jgi:hypothetical protein
MKYWNLFIAYDLRKPGQNYDEVRQRIRELGQYHQFQLSLFYVNTNRSPFEAFDYIATAMDSNDKLAVIDAAGGVVSRWDRPPIAEINAIWHSK